MNNVKLKCKYIAFLFWVYLFKLLFLFFPRKHWTICERGTDARDNGYWFYRYLKENHPQQKVFYIIDRSSVDYEKVKADAVQTGSIKSYWAIATAQKHISSHYALGLPFFSPKVYRLCGLHRKTYFLQHGVIMNDLPYLHRKNAPMKLFACGAKPEYDYILGHFGHPEAAVQYTGLARFDQLHNAETRNQILVMPTWRSYLAGCAEQELAESDYVTAWNKVLGDHRLQAALKQAGKTLVFYPHYEVQKKFLHLFSAEDPSVVIADFDHYDVQQLLKESQLLVTDYSSVFFDFAYMKKPCVYYQFDEERFFGEHYERGYFDYRDMGFGEVLTDHDALIDTILGYLKNDCNLKPEYAKRLESFFPLHDTNNCQRIFDAIQKLGK